MYKFLSAISIVSAFFLLSLFGGCRTSPDADTSLSPGDTLTCEAQGLLMTRSGSTVYVTIYNPWKKGRVLSRLALVPDSVDADIPESDFRVIKVPVRSILVYSSVHAAPLFEMGAGNTVRGIADADYFALPQIRESLKAGDIIDVGNSMSPSLERILELSPEVALVSPYENSGHGVLDKTGTVVIDMADYMEITPLARAEWILLLGALTDRLDEARQIFNSVRDEYNDLARTQLLSTKKPKVLTEVPYSGVWYQPGGNSYMSRLIRDAGGIPLLSEDDSTGSVQLDIANTIEKGSDADVWIIKSTTPVSRADVLSLVPLAKDIEAFKNGRVWSVDTSENGFYDDLGFHPERILRDYMRIFHEESAAADSLLYYTRIR